MVYKLYLEKRCLTKKTTWLPPCSLFNHLFWGSQPSSCEDIQASVWRGPHGKELKHPAKNTWVSCLRREPPVPSSGDCIPGQHLDYDLIRDPQDKQLLRSWPTEITLLYKTLSLGGWGGFVVQQSITNTFSWPSSVLGSLSQWRTAKGISSQQPFLF